jgi:phage terminase large subunit
MDTKNVWDRQEGEPNRWFQRFSQFRLLGYTRTIEAVYRADCLAKGRVARRPYKSWFTAIEQWQWRARAEAWDKHLSDLAAEMVETAWRSRIMAEVEVLGRMSEMGRVNIRDFVKLGADGHITGFDEEMLQDHGFLVKKIASSKGRTKSLSIEMYDAQEALKTMGAYHRLFSGQEERRSEGNASNFVFPADCIAPAFLSAYRDIRDRRHTEYLFFGGRGSTKSSFVSLITVWLLVNNPGVHALACRQVANTLRDSVYSQCVWAISELGLEADFKCTTSPLEIEYRATGQKIYFRGADDPGKIKSIKPAFGYIGILWFEELDQFHGVESIRKIEQSVIRGGDEAFIFKSFNPPRTASNWANKYAKIPKASQYQHHSNYLDVPAEWLGKAFLEEAEHLKVVNPRAYEHEYLGIANSAGGLVFENVQIRKITDAEIAQFDRVLHGLDWGYYPDPAHYVRMHYDAARLTLYIFGEYRALKASNRTLYDALVERGLTPEDLLIADSAEPKSVADFREYGAACRGAEKGPESVKYSMKWLQSLAAIVIDNERCPETAEEFMGYEFERDKDGEVISEYPDANNHAIDSTRYGTNLIWKRRGQ